MMVRFLSQCHGESESPCDAVNFKKNKIKNYKNAIHIDFIDRTLFESEPNISNLNLRSVFVFVGCLNRTSRCRCRFRLMTPEPEPNRTPASLRPVLLGLRPYSVYKLTLAQNLMYDSDSSGWKTPSEKFVPNSPKYPDSGNSNSDYASSVAILGEDGKLTS